MTDNPDNRRPRWPNFKQTEEFYNITIFFFTTSKFTVEVTNLADIYCIFKNFKVLKKYYNFVNFRNLFKLGHLGRSVIWDVGHLGLHRESLKINTIHLMILLIRYTVRANCRLYNTITLGGMSEDGCLRLVHLVQARHLYHAGNHRLYDIHIMCIFVLSIT